MELSIVGILALIVGVGIVLYLLGPSKHNDPMNPHPQQPVDPSRLSSEQLQRVKTLAMQNKKLEAIKLYRQFTHSNLEDSKRAVETL